MSVEHAAYIHIPFCISKCHYCDFNSYPGMGEVFDSYAAAVRKEINLAADGQAVTLYIGGGTPTVMTEQHIYSIVEAVKIGLSLSNMAEATIEANPATVDASKLEGLLTAGLNRISFGAQTFEDALLGAIGRKHTAADIYRCVTDARLVGFNNISLDLIYSLPKQTVDGWRDTLRQAVNLAPEHVSLYELTIEHGTPFAEMLAQGKLQLPSEEQQIEMYAAAESMLEAAGYEHYEISNFAMPGHRCQHNEFYWRNEEYYGFGAGAASYINGQRMKNVAYTSDYISRVTETGSAVETSEELSIEGQMGETVMLGLRLLEGVDLMAFRQRFGMELDKIYEKELERLTQQGLVEFCDSRLRLTHRGVLLSNEVMAEFVRSDSAKAAV
ncbi:MAG: radical SAM family heme chaperone HemW [Armatimonadota bacterium]|nr:radical SAM family heme chaperone HemW [Armatimonadota bacterium]